MTSSALPHRAIALTAVAFAGLCSAPAHALNIVLCNDDGISAANVRALKQRLVEAGHSVVLTAPVDNQSGRGGFIAFLQPVPALTGTERAARAFGLAAGAPGVGQDPADADVHYVNGTPVAACLYGIDVQARARWGTAPDLVISGPNEGNNTGHINPSSGTFNNLVYAINRGLPAIAVSDAVTTQITWSPTLPADSRAFEVADIVVRFVDDVLDAKPTRSRGDRHEERHGERHGKRRLMPEGIGLNINIPAFGLGTGPTLRYAATRIGNATAFAPAFYERLSDSPLAVGAGVNVARPGISLAPGGTVLPSGSTLPLDTDAKSEANRIAVGDAVTISPVQGVPEATREFQGWLHGRIAR